jgi:hypothetical protein
MCNRILATLDAAPFNSYNCSDLERFAISMSVRRSLSRRLRRAPVTTTCLQRAQVPVRGRATTVPQRHYQQGKLPL